MALDGFGMVSKGLGCVGEVTDSKYNLIIQVDYQEVDNRDRVVEPQYSTKNLQVNDADFDELLVDIYIDIDMYYIDELILDI